MKFPILYENSTVGEANVSKEGLYYHFVCRCTPPDSAIYRIFLSCGETEQSLGVCVPHGKHFVLSKKIPRKSIQEGRWEFYLRHKDANRIIVSVSEEEPFPFLDKLVDSSIQVENGETLISVKTES